MFFIPKDPSFIYSYSQDRKKKISLSASNIFLDIATRHVILLNHCHVSFEILHLSVVLQKYFMTAILLKHDAGISEHYNTLIIYYMSSEAIILKRELCLYKVL